MLNFLQREDCSWLSLLHSEREDKRVELLIRESLRWVYELLNSMIDRLFSVTSDMLAALEQTKMLEYSQRV